MNPFSFVFAIGMLLLQCRCCKAIVTLLSRKGEKEELLVKTHWMPVKLIGKKDKSENLAQ